MAKAVTVKRVIIGWTIVLAYHLITYKTFHRFFWLMFGFTTLWIFGIVVQKLINKRQEREKKEEYE